MKLPDPATFAEGQRRLYGLAVAAAGVAIGIAVCVGGGIVAFGDWGKDQLHFQLVILFTLLGGGLTIISFVIIGLLLGGPVGKFHADAEVGDKKFTVDADAKDAQP